MRQWNQTGESILRPRDCRKRSNGRHRRYGQPKMVSRRLSQKESIRSVRLPMSACPSSPIATYLATAFSTEIIVSEPKKSVNTSNPCQYNCRSNTTCLCELRASRYWIGILVISQKTGSSDQQRDEAKKKGTKSNEIVLQPFVMGKIDCLTGNL